MRFTYRFSNTLSLLAIGACLMFQATVTAQLTYTPGPQLSIPDWYDGNDRVRIADVDNDGDQDIVMGYLFFNDGAGNFTSSGQDMGRGIFADLDGDGDQDWICYAPKGGSPATQYGTYQNDGNGNFTFWANSYDSPSGNWPRPLNFSIRWYGATIGDVNGDGVDELVVARSPYSINVFFSDGDGTFTYGPDIDAPSWDEGCALADLDADGDLDLLTLSASYTYKRIWENDGAGAYTMTGFVFNQYYIWLPQFGDVNGDGKMDMVMAHIGGGSPGYVFSGNNDFTFTSQYVEYVAGGGYSSLVALKDMDFDGDLDFCGAKYIRLNDGSGMPGITVPVHPSGSVNYSAIADLDGDLDFDYVLFNGYTPGIGYIYLASGAAPPNTAPDCSGAAIADQSADAGCEATINETMVTGVTDSDGDPLTITVSPTTLVLGANNVTVTADDGNGGTCTTDITVNVADNAPPVMFCKNIAAELDAYGEASISGADIDDGSYDNCSGALSLSLTGQTTFDCDDLDETFSVTLSADDGNGNIGYCTAEVTISDDTLPDDDCDGVSNVCDNYPGGDDSVDYWPLDQNGNPVGDGIPDVGQLLNYNQYDPAWHCGNNKILVVHNVANNPTEICININALPAHFGHDDFVGPYLPPCNGQNLAAPGTGFNATTPTAELEVFPNPAGDVLNIHLHGTQDRTALTIHGQLGQVVWSMELEEGQDMLVLDLTDARFTSGIYFVSALTDGVRLTKRLVIAR